MSTEFDITKCEHSDKDVTEIIVDKFDNEVEYFLPSYNGLNNSIVFNKNDAIALAKHFKLTVNDVYGKQTT